jgi:hypothetical protein
MVNENDLDSALENHLTEAWKFLQQLPLNRWGYQYAAGKWTIKEMVQHIIDAERIFAYRALCIARGDKTSLPGFDENSYAEASGANNRNPVHLLDELKTAQLSTSQLFKSFDENQLQCSGIANGNSIYVEAIGFIAVGHTRHHLKILKERYQ